MAMYFPLFSPKVFSPRVLVGESKTSELCIGCYPFTDGMNNALRCYKYYRPSWWETSASPQSWSSIANPVKRFSFFPGLPNQRLLPGTTCCCHDHSTAGELSSEQIYNIAKCKSGAPTYALNESTDPRVSKERQKQGSASCSQIDLKQTFHSVERLEFPTKRTISDVDGVGANDNTVFHGQSFKFPKAREIRTTCMAANNKRLRVRRPKTYQCPFCDVCCSNQGQLKGHIRIHTGERPYRCSEEGCNKAFIRNEELTRHRRIHTGERPHKCVICEKAFSRKDHLNKHVKVHTFESDCVIE